MLGCEGGSDSLLIYDLIDGYGIFSWGKDRADNGGVPLIASKCGFFFGLRLLHSGSLLKFGARTKRLDLGSKNLY